MKRSDSSQRRHGDVVPTRLRALLSSPSFDGLRPPGAFGTAARSSADGPVDALPTSIGPPAARLRSSPLAPDETDAGAAPAPVNAARLDPGLPGARALAIVGVAAAVVAAGYLLWSRPDTQPVPAAAVRPALAASPSPATASSPSPSASVVVHVAGKVRHPGVVTLPPRARVLDAIEAAGGVRPGVGTATLNLARYVVDGEQILVGLSATAAGPVPPVGPAGPPGVPGGQLDLNAATVEQLQQLPGVGPVLAQRIVDYRSQHGGFHSVDQLQEVSGIGARRFADLKNLVRV